MGFELSHIVGGRYDYPFFPIKRNPYVKGIILYAVGSGVFTENVQFNEDVELVSVSVACSNYDIEDFWDMYVNGKPVCENIYTKDLPEGMNFMAVIPLKSRQGIRFEFNNVSGKKKHVWANFHVLR